RPALCFLSGQFRRVCTGSIGCRLLHSHRRGPAAPDHARADIPAATAGRGCPRIHVGLCASEHVRSYLKQPAPHTRCIPSPACGGGIGRGHAIDQFGLHKDSCAHSHPPPHPPPPTGGGGEPSLPPPPLPSP